jgi:uncharacterized pyridoxal phosphate-containing UPF0001 family protein
MEYVEGETLAERLEKRPLPLDQVLQYAIEIALSQKNKKAGTRASTSRARIQPRIL